MNKNIIYLGVVSFFTDFASAMINPILPIFVVFYLHESMDKLGIIVAIATFVSYMLRLASGFISDRFGIVKPLVVVGYTLSAIAKPLFAFTHSYKSVAALRAIERLGKAIRSAPKDAMLAHFGTKTKMGRTFGLHKSLDIAGEFSGTLALFLLLFFIGQSEEIVRSIFLATALPSILGLIVLIFLVQDVKHPPKANPLSLQHTDWHIIKELLFYFLFLLFFFSEAFFSIQAKKVGIDIAFIPLLFLLSSFTQTLTSYLSGVAIDRFSPKAILALSYLFGVVAQLLLWLQKPLFTWLSFIFLGLFTLFSLNANRTIIAQKASSKATMYGFYYAGVAIFSAIGAYVVGLIWHTFGMQTALLYGLFGSFTIATLFWLKALYGTLAS